jgi:glucan phosphorylase
MNNPEVPGLFEEGLHKARKIAQNLWWTWKPDALSFFESLHPALWESSGHNPLAIIEFMENNEEEDPLSQSTLSHEEMAEIADELYEALGTYLTTSFRAGIADRVVYLSMEYGIHESLPIYSGGLGILSGDHLKSSSDLGIPLMAVGLMYREGYFQQSIDDGGTQVATYPVVDPEKLPLSPLLNGHGEKMEIPVTIGDRVVYAQVWTANVGTVFLFLLDTARSRNNE